MHKNDVKSFTIVFGNVVILGDNGTILVPYSREYGTLVLGGVSGSRSNLEKIRSNCLRSSIVDSAYFRSSTIHQRLVIK